MKKNKKEPVIITVPLRKRKMNCFICGEMHLAGDLCPLLMDKYVSFIDKHRTSFLWGNVLYYCIKKNINYFDLLYETLYLEFYLRMDQINEGDVIQAGLDYVCTQLNISASELFAKKNDIDSFFLNLFDIDALSREWEDFNKAQKDNTTLLEMYSTIEASVLNEQLKTKKYDNYDAIINDNIRIILTKILTGKKEIYKVSITVPLPGIVIEDREFKLYYDIFDGDTITNGIVLFDSNYNKTTYDKLNQIFDDNFYYRDVALKISTSDPIFHKWMDALWNATKNKQIIWDLGDNYAGTYYGEYSISIHIYEGKYWTGDRETLFIQREDFDCIEFGNSAFIDIDDGQIISNYRLCKLYEFICKCAKESNESHKKIITKDKAVQNIVRDDVLMVTHSWICSKNNHEVFPCKGNVKLLCDNMIIEYTVYLGHCEKCNYYLMFKEDYDEMLKVGQPLCIVKFQEKNGLYPKISKDDFNYSKQSLLSIMGYTVQDSANISDNNRHSILSNVIENGIMSVHDVLDFLHWLIRIHPQQKYKNAILKWKNDIEYVENNITEWRRIEVKQITNVRE